MEINPSPAFIMFSFPEWSDLGGAQPDRMTQDGWDAMLMALNQMHYYYSGQVFKETVPGEYETGEEPPLMFPVGMNIVKVMCHTHTDAMFGEHDGTPIQFAVRDGLEETDADRKAIELLLQIFEANDMSSTLWETELDRNVYGGGALRAGIVYSSGTLTPNAKEPHERIRIQRITRNSFFPVFDPENPNELLKTVIVSNVSPDQAQLKYNFTTTERLVRTEVWTARDYKIFYNDEDDPRIVGANTFGIIPSSYIPRYRSSSPLGDSLAGELIPVQDEFNARMADISEAVNYGSNPIMWGINMPRGFNSENFPLGPGAMWDLGKSIGGYTPEVGALEIKNTVQSGTLDFMRLIYSWVETSAEAPPIAFGKDDGGGQRSGITLELRMWPLIKAVRRSRNYMRTGIRRLIKIIGLMLKQKGFTDVPVRAVDSILSGRIVPVFDPIMPRDHQAIVDEVVKLMSTEPKTISLETAQRILGRGPAEVTKILAMVSEMLLENSSTQDGDNENNRIKEKEDKRPDLKESNNG